MKNIFLTFIQFVKPFRPFIPTTRTDYFLHLLLVLDIGFILFKNSYEAILPRLAIGIIIGIDLFVLIFWGIRFLIRIKSKEDKIKYIQNSWYYIPGLVPLPSMRFFLLLSTVKLIIITYKFIKRGEKDILKFKDRELNFTFIDLFVDTISDAIFIRSLERVEEVVQGMDFSKLNSEVMEAHREEILLMVQNSLESKQAFKRLNEIPFLNGITKELSVEISETIIDGSKNPLLGKMMKELNLKIIYFMDERVRKLDLDRITSKPDE
jgi:hypothetical protein